MIKIKIKLKIYLFVIFVCLLTSGVGCVISGNGNIMYIVIICG